jgi:LmbE family N-acetylglucosaminyl deacetylase
MLKCKAQLVVIAVVVFIVAAARLHGQAPAIVDAAERRIAIEKLGVVGSALYVAAHPDDENTALLAYLAKGRKVRTAYLSLTRGDGGQNLIGTEQGDELAVIRTQELLAARRLDGAEQLFTRAVDFGYSKTPEETLRIWGKDAILADIVWVIRSFRPDVIISRFPANGDGGHGHHTASAILIEEAFRAAADPARFPEQLPLVGVWQAKRLVWNAWRRPGEQRSADAKPQVAIDLGGYDPVLGQSYTELAATVRSNHKSQGFGSAARRGPAPNYFEPVAGSPMAADLFEGVDLTWKRVANGESVGRLLAQAEAEYRDEDPAASVPALLKALAAIDALGNRDPLVPHKRAELLDVIRACAGLWLEAISAEPEAIPGSTLKVSVTAVHRSPLAAQLVRVELPFGAVAVLADKSLAGNEPATAEVTLTLPRELRYTQPYWLAGAPDGSTHAVPAQAMVGAASDLPALAARFVVRLGGQTLAYEVPVLYRSVDPVDGERYRDLAVVPAVTVNLEAPMLLFPSRAARTVRATARAHVAGAAATLELLAPDGWRVEPASTVLTFSKNGEEKALSLTVTPPAGETTTTLGVRVRTDRVEAAHALVRIEHAHIPPQILLPETTAKLVRVDVRAAGARVGYVMGTGDEIPAVLRQLGYEVTLLSDDQLDKDDLSRYGAIVTGARAYNTRERLAQAQPRLLDYVEKGGTLVVQYNNERGVVTDTLAPCALTLSRDRVTDEDALVTLLAAGHPLLTRPNTIGPRDFVGWVQERGLYYPSKWDAQLTPLLAMADPGEKPTQGALLVGSFGKGTYVYTGLAFFRQLPAGVPGAVRLFVNLLAGGAPRG